MLLLFIDLLRKNAIVGRIWFECLWVGTFCILELSKTTGIPHRQLQLTSLQAMQLQQLLSCPTCFAILQYWVTYRYWWYPLFSTFVMTHKYGEPLLELILGSPSANHCQTWHKPMASAVPQLLKPSDFSKRLVANSQYDLEKQQSARTQAPSSRIPAHLIEPSPRVSVIITPSSQSPVSDEFSYESSSSSDYTTSMLSGLPGSSLYVPYPLSTPRRSALMSAVMQSTPARSASHNRVPSSATLPSKTPTSTRAAVHPQRSTARFAADI
ncbi:hypothetical protein A0H81_04154 [Grifola frondosa]|uniref:Uncharacterized protein n=1 Tax=Grifola frondosa TaxID=5627 RepID=A0A1C7ME85_GRIFR|nr:hypothetical protein A0H81_04154 [Grifola frondosa]